MNRTLRAAVLADVITFVAVAGFGILLGFDVVWSIVAGLALGSLAALLLVMAGRRADTFHEPTPPSPSAPGAPDGEHGTSPGPTDPARRGHPDERD